jgi:hypothetical protein
MLEERIDNTGDDNVAEELVQSTGWEIDGSPYTLDRAPKKGYNRLT